MSSHDGSSLKGDLLNKLIKKSSKEFSPEETELPDRIFLLPLFDRPFFPSQTLPLIMSENYWLASVKKINKTPSRLGGLILSSAPQPEKMNATNFSQTGTLVRLHHPVRAAKKIQFIAEGLQRFHITKWLSTEPPYEVAVSYPEMALKAEKKPIYKAYGLNIINTLKEMMKYNPMYSEELKFFLNRFTTNEPSQLCDFAAGLTSSNSEELQSILDTYMLEERMEKVLILAKKELEMVKIQAQIRQDVEAKMTEHQRKFFLKEQLKTIQKELGIAKDDKTADREQFEERLESLQLSEAASKKVDNEMNKLSILETGSPEYAVTRNYLDLITSLPWGKLSKDCLSIAHARRHLNQMHEGLEDIKSRILEFIAVGALKGHVSGSIILLVGPPGVGKTSIGRSIANALNREFYRFSVGGMRDEAEIKGHRKTYVGAMPGKLIQALKECGSANPVIMLDEIDKMGSGYHGDPASALLEVLDPEQNSNFLDHYLETGFDLSNVLFVCTANQLDTIPQPLLDRMEILRLAGYLAEEKVAIVKKHLWPRLLERNGMKKSMLKIKQAAIKFLVEHYAREAGVRNLEKQLAKIIRKAALHFSEENASPICVEKSDIPRYLGNPLFNKEPPQHAVGVVNGLAWTSMGGATLSIEASCVLTSERGMKLTGQLGNVMQESAQIAYSYVLTQLEHFCNDPEYFLKRLVHLHVPEGATPKDGPSAGITMASALVSLARGEKPKKGIAMTGELTLTGQVLAVGGIREKVVAAKRNGIKEIILPASVKANYEELPSHIQKGMKVHFVSHYQEIFARIFKG